MTVVLPPLNRDLIRARFGSGVRLRRRLLNGITHPEILQYLQSVDLKNSRFRVGLPVAERAMKPGRALEPTAPHWLPDAGLRERIGKDKRITIFAIIDDGLPFAHRNFRDASGVRTRVEFCWLQSAAADSRQKLAAWYASTTAAAAV